MLTMSAFVEVACLISCLRKAAGSNIGLRLGPFTAASDCAIEGRVGAWPAAIAVASYYEISPLNRCNKWSC